MLFLQSKGVTRKDKSKKHVGAKEDSAVTMNGRNISSKKSLKQQRGDSSTGVGLILRRTSTPHGVCVVGE